MSYLGKKELKALGIVCMKSKKYKIDKKERK